MRWLIILILFTGCYSEQKARTKFNKAAIAYPIIPAEYCAKTFPPVTKTVPGVNTVTTDTVWAAGEVFNDTIYLNDTVRINRVTQLPGRIITNTITRTDTIVIENFAAITACAINRDAAINLAASEKKEREKYQARSKRYFWVLVGIGALAGLWLFFWVRKRVKK